MKVNIREEFIHNISEMQRTLIKNIQQSLLLTYLLTYSMEQGPS